MGGDEGLDPLLVGERNRGELDPQNEADLPRLPPLFSKPNNLAAAPHLRGRVQPNRKPDRRVDRKAGGKLVILNGKPAAPGREVAAGGSDRRIGPVGGPPDPSGEDRVETLKFTPR